jgi:Ribbon-helix-helix protein, copG family
MADVSFGPASSSTCTSVHWRSRHLNRGEDIARLPSCVTVNAQAGDSSSWPHAFAGASVDYPTVPSHITFMALSKKKATTIALDPEADQLLTRAARERGVSRSEFVRQQLALVLEQYRRHPKPRSAGIIRSLSERGNERELFGGRR